MAWNKPYRRWQHYLSYLSDQVLESGPSDHTENISVVLRDGRLLLTANDAVYSWEDKYYNFRHAFEHLDWDGLPGTDTLLLGLGLGSVPQMLEEHFGRELHLTAVEYDATIVALAEHYLLYRLSTPIQTVVADAAQYVAQTGDRFDLILVDLFVDDAVPQGFAGEGFLRECARLLNPGGCLISNRLALRTVDKRSAERYFDDVFLKVFPKGNYLDAHSNWMLFSDEDLLLDPT